MAGPNLQVSVMINEKKDSRRKVEFTGGAKELMGAIQLKYRDIGTEMWTKSTLQIWDDVLKQYVLLEGGSITTGQCINVVFPDDGKASVHPFPPLLLSPLPFHCSPLLWLSLAEI